MSLRAATQKDKFMPETEQFHAQLVMKRPDGTSILDTGEAMTSDNARSFDVTEERAGDIRKRLEEIGFTITSGNLNTLSISGPKELFAEVFGIEAAAPASGTSAHATRFPVELADCVADVFVPPAPTLFP